MDLVKEIAFLYKSDQESNRQLTLVVQVRTYCIVLMTNNYFIILQSVLRNMPASIKTDEVNLPVKVVGKFLHSIFENGALPPAIRLYAVNVSLQPVQIHDKHKFTLHSVHNKFSPLQMLQLIFTVFDGAPNSFQIFQCTPDTTEQLLNIFFDRVFHWSGMQYLLLNVNYLHNELQEVIFFSFVDELIFIYY